MGSGRVCYPQGFSGTRCERPTSPCAWPLAYFRSIPYIITEYSPNRRIVISGRSSFLNVNDTIELNESDGQTTISYRAEFHFKFGLKRLLPGLADALDRQCQLAIEGLESALTLTADEAVLSARNAKADARP